MIASANDTPGVVVRPPLLYLAALLIALALHWFRPMPIFGNSFAIVIGLTMAILGLAIAIWRARSMLAAGTNIDPTLPSTAIVTSGPFRLSRNPLYLALTLLYLGLSMAFSAFSSKLMAASSSSLLMMSLASVLPLMIPCSSSQSR